MMLYNNEKRLARTLESIVLNIDNIAEIILNDNGSTDKTEDICREYVSEYPQKFKYVRHKKNRGSFFHFVYLYRCPIKTKYLMLMRADNFIPKDYIKKMLDIAESEPTAALIYPSFYYRRTEPYHYSNVLSYINLNCAKDGVYNRIIGFLEHTKHPFWRDILYCSTIRTDYYKVMTKEVSQEIGFRRNENLIYQRIPHEDVMLVRLMARGKFLGVNVFAYVVQRGVESPLEISRRYKKALNQTYFQQINHHKLFYDFKNNILSKIKQKPINWEEEFLSCFKKNYSDFFGNYHDITILRFIRYLVLEINFHIDNTASKRKLISDNYQRIKLNSAIKNNSILKTLDYNNIKKVGIYGQGYLFKQFWIELKKSQYSSNYIVKSDIMDYDKDIYRCIDISDADDIYKLDAIIVIPAIIFDDVKIKIKEQLKENSTIRIISIWEVLECAFARDKYGIEIKFID